MGIEPTTHQKSMLCNLDRSYPLSHLILVYCKTFFRNKVEKVLTSGHKNKQVTKIHFTK